MSEIAKETYSGPAM